MRKNRFVKQSLALILSFVMSFNPGTLGNLVSFAETESVSISAETEITDEESGDSEESTEDTAPAEEPDDAESGFEESAASEENEESMETEGFTSSDAEDETENNETTSETDQAYTSEKEEEKSSDAEPDSITGDDVETETVPITEDDVETEILPAADPLEETEGSEAGEEQKSVNDLEKEETAEETSASGENIEEELELSAAPENSLDEKKELKTVRHILQGQAEGTTISVIYYGEPLSDDFTLEVRKADEDSQEQEEICQGILQKEMGCDSCVAVYEVILLDADGEEMESLPGKEDFIVFFESEEQSEKYSIYHISDKSSGTLEKLEPLDEDDADIKADHLLIPLEGEVLNDLEDIGTEDAAEVKNGTGTAVRTDCLGFFIFVWENEQTVLTNSMLQSDGNLAADQELHLSSLTWKELQQEIDKAPSGATIVLETDVTADNESDTFLKIDKSLTLDLNGHTLDRNLSEEYFPRSDGCVLKIKRDGILELTDSSTEGSGIITGGFGYYCAGGVDIENGGSFIMRNGIIAGNVSQQYGGGVNLKEGSFEMTGGKIRRNSALSGGGIYAEKNSILQVNGGEITHNGAGSGGGIYSKGRFIGSNAVINYNSASSYEYWEMYAVGGSFTVGGQGGGLYVDAANTHISQVSVCGNYSTDSAGGIYQGGGRLEMEECSVCSNMTENKDGGGILQFSGICEATDCIVEENRAGGQGGGILLGGNLFMVNGSVKNNTAGDAGGGIRISYGILNVMGSVKIEDNFGKSKTAKRHSNVQLSEYPVMKEKNRIVMTGALQEAHIGITAGVTPNKETPEVPFTSGLAGNGDASCFTPDQPYDVVLDHDGEAALKKNKRSFVYWLYLNCLNREPDQEGLDYWLNQIDSGTIKGIGLAKEFIFSKEFISKSYCNRDFVYMLYTVLMDRGADIGGTDYWTKVLDNGTKREELLNKFASCAEYRELCEEVGIELGPTISIPRYGAQPYGYCARCRTRSKPMEFAERVYRGCFKRTPDEEGWLYWSKRLGERTITAKKMLEYFFLSPEIRSKNLPNREYVQRIYKAMLNREPDNNGLNYWTGRLDKGDSPAVVINGIVDSEEFRQVCEAYGIVRK